jgi:hypothetical protein
VCVASVCINKPCERPDQKKRYRQQSRDMKPEPTENDECENGMHKQANAVQCVTPLPMRSDNVVHERGGNRCDENPVSDLPWRKRAADGKPATDEKVETAAENQKHETEDSNGPENLAKIAPRCHDA